MLLSGLAVLLTVASPAHLDTGSNSRVLKSHFATQGKEITRDALERV